MMRRQRNGKGNRQVEYEKKILVCENSMEGIFTAVYDGWHWGNKGIRVGIAVEEPEYPELFADRVDIISDCEKAMKVARSVRHKLGEQIYEAVCYAVVSTHPDKGTAVFYLLRKALGGGACDRHVLEALADPAVSLVSSLRIKVWHEIHRFYGFVRFRELAGGSLISSIHPENDILELLGPHFSNRFPNENWMIYDEKRKKVLVHEKGKECSVYVQVTLNKMSGEFPGDYDEYEALWKSFCTHITIKERTDLDLQKQFVPLKFRSNMLEFYQNGR